MLAVTSRERRRDGWGFKDLTETNLYPIQSLPHTIHNLYSQGSLSSMMTNRPVRPQAFRSSSRLLPRAWACTGNEDHCQKVGIGHGRLDVRAGAAECVDDCDP